MSMLHEVDGDWMKMSMLYDVDGDWMKMSLLYEVDGVRGRGRLRMT